MSTLPARCERCEEPILPRAERPGLVPRMFGNIERVTYRVRWTTWREQWSARFGSAEGPSRSTSTQVDLCDECWGALLSWVNDPVQERAKIAAENRRYRERVAEVSEQRRERQVQRYADDLKPGNSEPGGSEHG